MSEKIENEFGFNAGDAISQIGKVDAALAQLESRIRSFASTAKNANAAGASFTKMGATSQQAFTQLNTNATKSGRVVGGVFNELITANGRFSTSLALLSRILFTQAVVRGFRAITSSIEGGLKAAREFNTKLAEIQTIAGGKLGSDQQIGDQLRDISGRFNLELPDTATSLYDTISNQVVDTADSFKFLEEASILAKGGVGTLEDAVNLLSGTLNTLHRPLGDASQISSQFFSAIEVGVFTMKELNAELPKVLPLADQLGISLEEVLAAMAALTQQGLKPAQAATALRGTILGLIKPSEDLTKTFDELGFSSAEQLLQTEGFGGALKKLLATTDGTSEGAAKLFRNQRALTGALALGNAAADKYSAALTNISEVSTNLAKEKAQQVLAADAQVLEAAAQKVGNAWEVAGEKINHVLANNARFLTTLSQFQLGGAGDGVSTDALNALVTAANDLTTKTQTANSARTQDASQTLNKIVSLRKLDVDSAKQQEKEIIATAQGGFNRLQRLSQQRIDLLQKQINSARQLIKDGPGRIADLENQGSGAAFRGRLGGLDEGQKSLALQQEAGRIASQAAADFARAARAGDDAGLERARVGFQTARSTAEEAASVAQTAGEYGRAGQAAQNLQGIISSQVGAEREAVALAKSRLPALEAQARVESERLVNIQKGTKEFIKNLAVLDKDGGKLSPDALQKRKDALETSAQQLLKNGVTHEQLSEITLNADKSLVEVRQKAEAAFTGIKLQFELETGVSVDKLQEALGRRINTPAGITQGLSEVTKELDALTAAGGRAKAQQQGIDDVVAAVSKFADVKTRLKYSSTDIEAFSAFPELKEVDKLSFQGLQNLIDNLDLGPLSARARSLVDTLKQLQTLKEERNSSPRGDGRREALLQDLLSASPATAFQTAASLIEGSANKIAGAFKSAADSAASSAERAVAAAERAARAGGGGGVSAAKGGRMSYFADGGLARGTDTIPAMLTRGEFVMPAKETSQFYSELTAMRAGISPFGQQSVSSTGIAGDVVINVHGARGPQQTAEEIEARLRRAKRRGAI